jgi:16S rRNA (guanine(966)-N(2))-methyltransferase RsmD
MHIRIISGKYKGRRIKAPGHLPIRPTTDRAKEALFNILHHQLFLPELKILDLFTGSGNISYEFASRGVKNIVAVDNNFQAVKFVQQTARSFDFNIKVVKKDVLKFLKNTTEKYDLIFADPPYNMDKDLQNEIINTIFEKKLLIENGMFILEHIEHIDFSEHKNFIYSRKYGLTVFSFFELK